MVAHDDPAEVASYERASWWQGRTLSECVTVHAREQPAAAAFVEGDHRVSWSEHDADATQLAGALVAAGFTRNARIAVLLPDGPAIHAVFVGLERAGLVVVGIGARAGDREIDHLLGKTEAVAIITLASHRERQMGDVVPTWITESSMLRSHIVVPESGRFAGRVTVDGVTPMVAVDALVDRALGANELSLINSTSGTTGLPKCVLHNQSRWFYFHQLAVETGRLDASDVFLSVIPAPFGFGLWTSHFTPTILGAPTVVMARFDATEALRTIARERVTVLCCVSTQFIMLLNSPEIADHDLTSLRVMFTGGEAVPYERAAAFEDVTGAKVLQFYGSNETGAISRTSIDDTRLVRLTTAGRIIDEMQVRLFDQAGADVTAQGVGQPGCRGPATCIGYLDDAGANAQLFTDDGWMLAGDIVQIDTDGVLTVTGRVSDFIIRGGKNISAPAVEAEVLTHPGIAMAAAVAMPDSVFGERVCIVVEMRPGSTVTLAELVEHLRGRGVSSEWLPERLEVVDELPRASGGKVAKGQLREMITRLSV